MRGRVRGEGEERRGEGKGKRVEWRGERGGYTTNKEASSPSDPNFN